MEARQDAAGNRHEEDGQEVAADSGVLGDGAGNLAGAAVTEDGAEVVGVVEVIADPRSIPHLNERVLMDEDADEDADGGEEQDGAEDRVDTADDGVDREHGGDQVVQEDDTVDNPGSPVVNGAGAAEDLSRGYVARGVNEHRADEEQQDAQEDVVHREDTLVGVLLDGVRHLVAAVAQADHAAEVVVHGAAEDVADGDGDEGDGPKQDALDRSKDRARARDVKQVYEAVLPAAHGDVVNAVALVIRGSLAVIRAENVLAELAVQRSADEQDNQTDDKGYHKLTLLLVFVPLLV